MNKNRILNTLLATTVIGGALGIATPAFAQGSTPPANSQTPPRTGDQTQPQAGPVEGTPNPTTSANGEETNDQGAIVVTGTRIPQPNLTSTSPVTVINNAEVKLQGATRTEDIINSLPQSFAAQGSNISNGATGTSSISLRGLGSRRTMVLVNGRRLMPGDPRSPVPDINFVPALAVDRIDVLTGGASSVYGADAVAGVVNFIMDTKFEGIRLDSQYSFFDHVNNDDPGGIREAMGLRNYPIPNGHTADGGTVDASMVIGAGFNEGRGHITAYATYRRQHSVLQRDRDYSACSIASLGTPAADGRLYSCGGSSTTGPGGRFFIPTTGASFSVGPNRTLVPGFQAFNFAPYNYFQRPDERYTFGTFANYEISPALKPYLEAMFMDDRSVAQIAPSGLFFGNLTDIGCNSALMSAQQRSIICAPANLVGFSAPTATNPAGTPPTVFLDANGNPYFRGNVIIGRRNVEGGGRRDDLQHTAFRVVTGLRGDLGGGFSYDAYYQYGRVNFAQTYFNDFSIQRLSRALDVGLVNGVPTCNSVISGTDPNCVPYDIFTPGGVTQAALNYLQTPGFSRGNTQETVINGSITAQLGEYGLQSPVASHGVAVNIGGEYRKEKLEFATDTEFSTGDLAGQGGATIGVNGQFSVKEFFTEVQVPLVEDRPLFQQLDIRGGYRYSKYTAGNNHFTTSTYKLEGDWAPVQDVRFRGGYNRAVRAPNVVELFTAQSVQLDGSTDPCAGATPTATASQCALMGVSAAQYGHVLSNSANQYNGLTGGNPNLTPEKADTITAGVVIQPRFIPRFAFSIDWFSIKVKNLIGTVGADTILSQCVATGSPTFCSLVHRDQFGSLWISPNGYVVDTNLNVGDLKTRGFDVNASYSHQMFGLGTLAVSFVGTYLQRLEINGSNCAGYWGAQCSNTSGVFTAPNPKWRHKARVTFTFPDGIGLSAQWRYFSRVRNEGLSSDPVLHGTVAPGDAQFKAQNYIDLVLTAKIGDHYQFRLGANNIFDRIPPIAVTPAPYGNGNTYPQTYDALGRYIFAGVTLDF